MKKNIIAGCITIAIIAITIMIAMKSGIIRIKGGQSLSVASAHASHAHTTNKPCESASRKNEPDQHGYDVHEDEPEGLVHVTSEQLKLINLKITPAVSRGLSDVFKLDGEIRLNMDKTANLMPRMPGFVEKIVVKAGDKVKKNQILATITSHKLGEYYANYKSALEREKLTLADFSRADKLHKRKAVSKSNLQHDKQEYADAAIARRHAEALLKSLMINPKDHLHESDSDQLICTDYDIRAPFNGTVIAKNITVGENFPDDNDKIIFTVSDLSTLWLDLRASNVELRSIKTGMNVSVTPADSKKRYHGKVSYLAPLIDLTTRRGLVRVEIDNRAGELRPGEFAFGTILRESGGKQIVVPQDAVQLVAGERVIFVPRGDGFFPQVVQVGKSSKGYTQIIAGLRAGEKYVSAGAFELKSILITSGMDPHAGHGH